MASFAWGLSPQGKPVYTYFRNWRKARRREYSPRQTLRKNGTWLHIHDNLREWTRIEQEGHPSPSEAIIDSQSAKSAGQSTLSGRLCVKSAAMVSQGVGYDAGKKIKGRKRFITVDTLGLVLRILVTSANVGEREGGKKVLKRVKQSRQQASRLTTIWVDGGFDGEPQIAVGDGLLPLPKRRWCCAQSASSGFVLLKKRWVVERTFGWLMGCRRLVRDYELLPQTSETFIYLAMIRIMVRRLA